MDGDEGGRPERPGARITVFRERTGILSFHLILGGMMMLQGVLTAIFFIFYGSDEIGITVTAVGLSLFLAWAGYWFAGHAWRRMRDPANPITIGPAGLYDRAISERPIAWGDVRNLHVWADVTRGGPVVVFDLAEGAAERAGVHPRVQHTAPINRPFGYDYRIHSIGTDATIEALVEAIAPYAEVNRGE
jgi:hypothetical protein